MGLDTKQNLVAGSAQNKSRRRAGISVRDSSLTFFNSLQRPQYSLMIPLNRSATGPIMAVSLGSVVKASDAPGSSGEGSPNNTCEQFRDHQ
jgi:hypothetical protein